MSPTLAGGIFITAPPGNPKLFKNSINDQLDGLIYRILQTPIFFLILQKHQLEENCHHWVEK